MIRSLFGATLLVVAAAAARTSRPEPTPASARNPSRIEQAGEIRIHASPDSTIELQELSPNPDWPKYSSSEWRLRSLGRFISDGESRIRALRPGSYRVSARIPETIGLIDQVVEITAPQVVSVDLRPSAIVAIEGSMRTDVPYFRDWMRIALRVGTPRGSEIGYFESPPSTPISTAGVFRFERVAVAKGQAFRLALAAYTEGEAEASTGSLGILCRRCYAEAPIEPEWRVPVDRVPPLIRLPPIATPQPGNPSWLCGNLVYLTTGLLPRGPNSVLLDPDRNPVHTSSARDRRSIEFVLFDEWSGAPAREGLLDLTVEDANPDEEYSERVEASVQRIRLWPSAAWISPRRITFAREGYFVEAHVLDFASLVGSLPGAIPLYLERPLLEP